MENRDLDRVRFVTRHFNDLQGLRYWVPLGLITLGWGGPTLLRVVLFLGAFLLLLGARRYYRNTFGEVEPQPVDLAVDVYSFSVFSPAAPTPRLEGVHLATPMARRFLATAALTTILFTIFQAIPPNFLVEGHESLGQHPRITSLPSGVLERPWIVGSQPQPSGIFQPPWVAWIYSPVPTRPPSMLRAVFAQTIYVFYGSLFLGLWLWRERRRSQSHHLVLAVLMLGLAALGTSLGFVVGKDREIAPLLDFFLPALVYPGVALLLCGAAMVLAGLFDHWQLVRALGGLRGARSTDDSGEEDPVDFTGSRRDPEGGGRDDSCERNL